MNKTFYELYAGNEINFGPDRTLEQRVINLNNRQKVLGAMLGIYVTARTLNLSLVDVLNRIDGKQMLAMLRLKDADNGELPELPEEYQRTLM